MKNRDRRWLKKHWWKLLLAILLALATGIAWYITDIYPAENTAETLQSSAQVQVEETAFGYVFDGPGTEQALIFYPGAKVDEVAYASLLKKIAERGVDAFLVKMPFHLAVLDMDKAEQVKTAYDYKDWYLGGHSMGGAMAASYLAENPDDYEGLILLAAYSVEDLSQTKLKALSIYGDQDQVLNREKVQAGHDLLPADNKELVIEGGNHAGFGNYGPQKGDGRASISAQDQQDRTVEAIIQFINAQ